MIDLEALERAVRKNDSVAIAALFSGATEADRKATRPLVRELEAEEARWWRNDTGVSWSVWSVHDNPVPIHALDTLRLATTPSAAGAARVLRANQWSGPTPERVRVIVERRARWNPELVDRLTTATRDSTTGRSETPWEVVAPLLEQLGLRHLDTPAYGLEFLRGQPVELDGEAQLAVDPELPQLLLRAIRSDRIDEAVREDWQRPEGQRGKGRWARIAAEWAAAGHLDRAELHRTLMERLIAGGVQPHLRELLLYLDELSPTPAEVRELQREYEALIEARFSAVASHAIKALRAADAAEPLDTGTVLDICERALTRTEATTATAALGWLKTLLARDPAAADSVARAAEVGLDHPKRSVQDAAAALAGPAAPVTASSALPERPPLPPCPPFDVPASPEEFLHLTHLEYRSGDAERLLHGFARHWHALSKAQQAEFLNQRHLGIVDALARGLRPKGFLSGLRDRIQHPVVPENQRDSLDERAVEAARAAQCGPVTLLSAPLDISGFVEPAAVLDGLRHLARAGAAALTLDLEATYLRLPGSAFTPSFAKEVAAIPGPSALWLADMLARGPHHPTRMAALEAESEWHSELAVVPRQRETIIGKLLPTLRPLWDDGTGPQFTATLALPYQEGPVGTSIHTLLALDATAENARTRAAGLDATLGLLATDDALGTGAGPAWAALWGKDHVKLGRWTAHLGDVGRSSIAGSRFVWEVLQAVLSAGLPAGLVKRSGVADLVGLASDAAREIGARGTVAGLDEIADRPGKSRIVTEARRLRDVLRG
ncbi:MAG: DUF6493 family protein [Propionibacteriaceae bacterium]|nr:DUF6493 family protein [Propionibacteriaceae bacterium]